MQTKLRISLRNMQNDGKAVNLHYRIPKQWMKASGQH